MTHLVSKIEALLLEEPLDSLCGASAVYLTIENNILPSLEYVREIADRAVNSSLLKVEEIEQNTKILEVSTQISSGYISIKGLKAFKALNIEKELSPDYSHEEIVANINMLKYKLEHPGSEINANLYGSLKQALQHINPSELTWQKKVFLEPRENMKCAIPESVTRRCDEFVGGFINSNTSQATRNISHNKKWKESEHKLVEASERILGAL